MPLTAVVPFRDEPDDLDEIRLGNHPEPALDKVTERPKWQSDLEFYRWRVAAQDPVFSGAPKERTIPAHRHLGRQFSQGGTAFMEPTEAWGAEHNNTSNRGEQKAAKHAKQLKKQKQQTAVAVLIIVVLAIIAAVVVMMPYEQRLVVLYWIVFVVAIMLGIVLCCTCLPAVKQVGDKYWLKKEVLEGQFQE